MKFSGMKAALHNLGCKVNMYEAEAILNELKQEGAEIVPFGEKADIYIVNTCSVTNIADRKSRQMLHRCHEENPDAVVIGIGCYVQARAEELKKDSAVDILIGNDRKGSVVSILEEYLKKRQAALTDAEPVLSEVPDILSERHFEELPAGAPSDRSRAFIKIQDGCNQYCSYCIIPYVRGHIRSRAEDSVLREVQKIADSGLHEIVLTGIHLSSYGLDFDNQNYEYAMNHEIPSDHLLSLIESCASVPGIERIRLGSLEPRIITRNFVERISAVSEICPHFHLSLQSGCDRTLKRMNRHYDTDAFREAVSLIRERFPNAAITTDIIVGFPGETEADFEESRKFIEEIGFYELHVFKYSRRKGTVADQMPEQLTNREKSKRSDVLIEMNRAQSTEFRKKFLKRPDHVLLEEEITENGKHYLTGYNREYVRFYVEVPENSPYLSQIGEIVPMVGREIRDSYVLADFMEMA